MAKVKFTELEVEFLNDTVTVSGIVDNSTFSDDELKDIIGYIIQGFTTTSDLYGNPTAKVTIINKSIYGSQSK